MTELHALHHSVKKSRSRSPRNMAFMHIPHSEREFIEQMALSIFTDMVNAGCSLQATLAAIYLSGCENAIRAKDSQ